MTNDNQDALRSLYEVTGNVIDANTVLINRAELRRLVAENEAKDALLRQAVEALENGKRVRNHEGGTKYQPPIEDSAIAAIRQHLDQKTT